jgi:hypothetical protein
MLFRPQTFASYESKVICVAGFAAVVTHSAKILFSVYGRTIVSRMFGRTPSKALLSTHEGNKAERHACHRAFFLLWY